MEQWLPGCILISLDWLDSTAHSIHRSEWTKRMRLAGRRVADVYGGLLRSSHPSWNSNERVGSPVPSNFITVEEYEEVQRRHVETQAAAVSASTSHVSSSTSTAVDAATLATVTGPFLAV